MAPGRAQSRRRDGTADGVLGLSAPHGTHLDDPLSVTGADDDAIDECGRLHLQRAEADSAGIVKGRVERRHYGYSRAQNIGAKGGKISMFFISQTAAMVGKSSMRAARMEGEGQVEQNNNNNNNATFNSE